MGKTNIKLNGLALTAALTCEIKFGEQCKNLFFVSCVPVKKQCFQKPIYIEVKSKAKRYFRIKILLLIVVFKKRFYLYFFKITTWCKTRCKQIKFVNTLLMGHDLIVF